MKEIIEQITSAEAEAATIRQDATKQAAQIIAEAEAKASLILRGAEAERASYTSSSIKMAETEANEAYKQAIAVKRGEVSELTSKILENSQEEYADKIVGRIICDS